jgi:hypothetical protein
MNVKKISAKDNYWPMQPPVSDPKKVGLATYERLGTLKGRFSPEADPVVLDAKEGGPQQ